MTQVGRKKSRIWSNNEVTILLGRTILNSDNSESANAGSLEYRRGLWRYADVAASYIHEEGKIQSRRDATVSQRSSGPPALSSTTSSRAACCKNMLHVLGKLPQP
ncbi:MAG: hypothetical protein QOG58_4144 [Caballeronia sp.]|jgi:hypothetical protein|nr:hypothetical protein [Caballeronia sp.]